MSEEENNTLELTVDLWNAFVALPGGHPDDIIDVKFHIHALQRIIVTRSHFSPNIPPSGSPVLAEVIRSKNTLDGQS